MVALELLAWWYSQGWVQIAKNARLRLTKVSHLFSVPILVRTLFAPWRRIVTYPGAGIDAKMRAIGDNFVSRMIGFSVRMIVLFSAGVMLAFVSLAAIIQLVLWPILPPLIVVLIFKGLIG